MVERLGDKILSTQTRATYMNRNRSGLDWLLTEIDIHECFRQRIYWYFHRLWRTTLVYNFNNKEARVQVETEYSRFINNRASRGLAILWKKEHNPRGHVHVYEKSEIYSNKR